MNKQELTEIISDHREWLEDSSKGKRANLSNANLSRADLYGANLSSADLYRADLYGVDLSNANLAHANLYVAELSGANLYRAILYYANLSNADLLGANLSYANLFEVNLSHSYLTRANLYGINLLNANLLGTKLPSPSEVLLANWGDLSDELTQKAMAYDAFFHEDPKAFDRWKETGECPYNRKNYQRACNFTEKASLWDPTIPCPRGFDLMVEIIREKCGNSDWH